MSKKHYIVEVPKVQMLKYDVWATSKQDAINEVDNHLLGGGRGVVLVDESKPEVDTDTENWKVERISVVDRPVKCDRM